MTPEHLAAIRRRSTAAVQAYRFGTTGTTPMDVDGLTINEALDIVAESAKDVPALLAEVDRLRAGIEALRKEYRHPDCFDALRRVAAADLAALLNPEDPS